MNNLVISIANTIELHRLGMGHILVRQVDQPCKAAKYHAAPAGYNEQLSLNDTYVIINQFPFV
jgi:hypothetical protein